MINNKSDVNICVACSATRKVTRAMQSQPKIHVEPDKVIMREWFLIRVVGRYSFGCFHNKSEFSSAKIFSYNLPTHRMYNPQLPQSYLIEMYRETLIYAFSYPSECPIRLYLTPMGIFVFYQVAG